MLEISGLHTHYGLSHILQGVSLTAGEGEVIGLFGRNGVGKTTILRTIAGWVTPTDGGVRLQGRSLAGLAPDAICRAGVGFVPEDRRIFPGLTVEENLRLGLLQCPKRSRAESRAAVETVLDRFPRLRERHRQAATTLSGGEQQMLAMARVMVGDPRLLLIDEPTEGLAPMIVDEIFQIMEELRAKGLTILLVEQNVHRAIELVDRFYAIERGTVIHQGQSADPEERRSLMAHIAV